MPNLKEQIQQDFNQARLTKNESKIVILSFLLSRVHNKEIEKKGELTEAEIISLIKTEIKQREEAKEAFQKAGREEEVSQNKSAIEILKNYLPTGLSETEIKNEITKAIQEASAKGPEDIGKVMSVIMPKLAGKAEGELVSKIVGEVLSQGN